MKPQFSVIIPVYKTEVYLKRCVRSLLRQNFKNLEIILIDDGSPDRCPEICDRFAARCSEISVIHQENRGLSAAKNTGLAAARGEWIMFLDSDDRLAPGLFDALLPFCSPDIDLIEFGHRKCTNHRRQVTHDTGSFTVYTKEEAFLALTQHRVFSHMSWGKICRKQLFEGFRFIPGRLCEDLPATYELFTKAGKIGYLDRTFYEYYIRADSIMGNVSCRRLHDSFLGETEIRALGRQYFPEFHRETEHRFIEQSVKFLTLASKHCSPKEYRFLSAMITAQLKAVNRTSLDLSSLLLLTGALNFPQAVYSAVDLYEKWRLHSEGFV